MNEAIVILSVLIYGLAGFALYHFILKYMFTNSDFAHMTEYRIITLALLCGILWPLFTGVLIYSFIRVYFND